MNIWNTNLRFNIDKSPYKEAYGYLHSMDRNKHKSINRVIAAAVVDYFERFEKAENDPYFENREREDLFIERIIGTVKEAVEKAMPAFMSTYIMNNAWTDTVKSKISTAENISAENSVNSNTEINSADTEEDLIDYSFAEDF